MKTATQRQRPHLPTQRSRELTLSLILLFAALSPRLLMVTLFPTQPISDFAGLVGFGKHLMQAGMASSSWHWDFFSTGLPLTLSLLFRWLPFQPEATARLATALLTGTSALLPWFLWRGTFSRSVRFASALMLAIWPAQIIFSGVVAQDNWLIPIGIALAVLAIRAQQPGRQSPLWGAILFVLGTSMRQEMLLPLLPLALVVAVGRTNHGRTARLGRFLAISFIGLGMLAGHRAIVTGRFSITSTHSSYSILGAYAPGAGANYWTDPSAFLAAENPALLDRDMRDLGLDAYDLVWKQLTRRPRFHFVRIIASTLNALLRDGVTYWSLTAEGVLPPELLHSGQSLASFTHKLLPAHATLLWWSLLLLLPAALRRQAKHRIGAATICLAILLKVAIHAITVAQPRYFLIVQAWAMLLIAAALGNLQRSDLKLQNLAWLAVSGGIALSLAPVQAIAEAYVLRNDVFPTSYAFPLGSDGLRLQCEMHEGRLISIHRDELTMAFTRDNPNPGDRARAVCHALAGETARLLIIEVFDPYPLSGLPDRVLQRVAINNKTILEHDLAAEAGAGWTTLGPYPLEAGSPISVAFELIAVYPDPEALWGRASQTSFRLLVRQAGVPQP